VEAIEKKLNRKLSAIERLRAQIQTAPAAIPAQASGSVATASVQEPGSVPASASGSRPASAGFAPLRKVSTAAGTAKWQELSADEVAARQRSNGYGVDLAFCIDLTGSMTAHIAAVKDKVQTIIDDCKAAMPDTTFHTSVVGYRDYGDGADHLVHINFTNHADQVKSFLLAQKATGGADAAEDVTGGLKIATELDWKAPNRFLFIIGDAPCHGSAYHTKAVGDDHPDGKPGMPNDPCEFMRRLQERKVQCFFLRINGTTDQMVGLLKAAYDVTPAPAGHEQRSMVTVDLAQQLKLNGESLAAAISHTVSSAIKSSVTASVAYRAASEMVAATPA